MSDLEKTGGAIHTGPVEAQPVAVVADDEQNLLVDAALEKSIVCKFDPLVLPQMMIFTSLAYLDRSNVALAYTNLILPGNARVSGFEEGINLKGTQFNDISSLLFVTYVIFEVPWVIAVKRWGANKSFIQNYSRALVMRLLQGATEAELFPALTLVISTIWDCKDQGKRVSLLYMAGALSGAFGGLIAHGISVDGGAAWEKSVMLARKTREAECKGTDRFEWRYVRMAFTDTFVYGTATLFASFIPLFGFSTFLPTILKELGHTGIEANYLSIPCYVLAGFTLLLWTYLFDPGYLAMFLCAADIYPYTALLLTWRSVGMPLHIARKYQRCYKRSDLSFLGLAKVYQGQGNSVSLGMEVVACFGIGFVYFLLRRRDKQKEELLTSGVEDNRYAGEDRGLGFRYTL
ncbi:major facilitator superfamily domain-containing protein [Aspergillus undulatus]|uniref:major facilitator superfamily domain-containing protein n=1 Tax=Aspergillus undulatus TaxID=1810928 RepID=UPI003CCCB6A6